MLQVNSGQVTWQPNAPKTKQGEATKTAAAPSQASTFAMGDRYQSKGPINRITVPAPLTNAEDTARFLYTRFQRESGSRERLSLVKAIGMTRTPGAVDILREIHDRAGDSMMRRAAIHAMGATMTPQASRWLGYFYRSSNDSQTRSDITMALGATRYPDAVPELMNIFRGSSYEGEKMEVIAALGRNKTESAVEALKGLMDQNYYSSSMHDAIVEAIEFANTPDFSQF